MHPVHPFQILAAVGIAFSAHAGNPLVPSVGMADPHGVVFGDRVYLYCTHDAALNNKKFVMNDWWVWSSADLVNWKKEGTLDPKDTYLGRPYTDCWATFGVTHNGKYYWYFSAGPQDIGVVVADSPNGPWKDPLHRPLIARGQVPTMSRDPDILMDADGKAYIVFGTFDYFVARLNDDMMSLAEKPRPIELDHKDGPTKRKGQTDDKPSLHQRNGVYYLSWSSFYATADNPYGPFTYKGSIIKAENLAPEFRTDKLLIDRHGNFFTFQNQWYYVFNDRTLPGSDGHFRNSVITYVHYLDNGDIAPILLDKIGVGEYDAGQPRIEAENYFAAEGVEVKQAAGGFAVLAEKPGGFVTFPKIKGLAACSKITLRVSAPTSADGSIEIHEGGPQGLLLATCPVKATGEIDAAFASKPVGDTLSFVFTGPSPAGIAFDSFSLSK